MRSARFGFGFGFRLGFGIGQRLVSGMTAASGWYEGCARASELQASWPVPAGAGGAEVRAVWAVRAMLAVRAVQAAWAGSAGGGRAPQPEGAERAEAHAPGAAVLVKEVADQAGSLEVAVRGARVGEAPRVGLDPVHQGRDRARRVGHLSVVVHEHLPRNRLAVIITVTVTITSIYSTSDYYYFYHY